MAEASAGTGLPEEDRLRRRGGFSAEAARYDRVRPTYPSALFDAVAEYGRLGRDSSVLEIAPGTGQAMAALVDRGWRVDAVELGAGMADLLRARLGDRVAVTVGAFEDLPAPRSPYDLVLCATAFHWLDPARRVGLVARALAPGGTAAIVWTRHVAGRSSAFFTAADACYAEQGEATQPLPAIEGLESHTAEFERSPAFADVERRVLTAEIEYGTADYLDLVSTYSETLVLDADRRAALLDCFAGLLETRFGGRAVKRYAFELVLARRR